MEPVTLGVIGLVALVVLIALGVPLAFAITLVAVAGIVEIFDFARAAVQIFNMLFTKGTSFILASVPLFIFMGQLVSEGNIGKDLYDCVHKWFGRLPGGLAITSVLTSAGFGAVTGVSAAAVATMATISLPEMRRYDYDIRLAAGSIASASTLAILVPPSLLLVLYGVWTETSIGQLFIAGIVPAILMSAVFCLYIYIRCRIAPEMGPTGPRYPLDQRLRALGALAPILTIFVIVIGGIYAGVFTPSEAAGVGCFAVLVLLILTRRLDRAGFVRAVLSSARLTVMIFTIFIAVNLFTSFLAVTEITPTFIGFLGESGLNRYLVMAIIVAMFVLMGMVLDPIGMLLLALPFVFPVAMQLAFHPVWFGVIITVLVEIALVTPPVGFNCYILKQIAGDVEISDIFLGTGPFVVMSLLLIAGFTAFPAIVLWLPEAMF